MKEKISVIVPIYNVEKYLRRCLESLVNQTYTNLEIILVNDGSTDNCLLICEEYKSKDHRIKLITKKNGGLSDARNVGMTEMTGEYVSFIDSDDFLELDMFEKLIIGIKENSSDICICGTIIDFEDGKKTIKKNDNLEILNSKEAIIKMNSFSSFDMAVWNKLYKRFVVEGIKFPIGKKSEDYFVMYKYFDKAQKIVVIPEAKYHYFQRNNSISRSTNVNYDFIEGSKEQQRFINIKYPEISCVANTAYAFSHIAIYNKCLEHFIELDNRKKKQFRKEVRKYIIDIITNPYIKNLKKIQAIVFIFNFKVYDFIYKNIK